MALPRFSSSFQNITIAYKLIGGFGVILLLFLGIVLISGFSGRSTVTNFESLISTEITIATHAANIDALMLQCRRNEKDFILRKNKTYVEALEKNAVKLKSEAEIIIGLAKISGNPKAGEQASNIIHFTSTYVALFRKLVASYEKKGLDHNSGLQGQFRNTVHNLADTTKNHQMGNAYMAFLQMRGYEKDYIRTWSGKYKPRLIISMNTFKEVISMEKNTTDSMNIIQKGFTEYENGFQRYFNAEENIRPIIYEEIRSSARDIEAGLTRIYVRDAYGLTLAVRRNEKDYLLRHDDTYAKQTHQSLDALVSAFRNAAVLPEYKESISRLVSSYRNDFDALVREDKIIVGLTAGMREVVHKIEPLVSQLKDDALGTAEIKIHSTETSAFSILNIVVGVALAAFIFGIFLSLIITRGITRPISQAVAFSEKLSKGDLTQTLEVTGINEIGALASALNQMAGKLAHMLGKIAMDAGSLTAASEELFGVSSMMTEGAAELSGKSNNVSAATEGMSTSMISVAAASEEATTNLNILATATEDMTSTIREIAENAENAKNSTDQAVLQVESATEKINALGTSAHDISTVTEAINDISEQTNLLALNATIEAARAGDAGKGFAVVANEIKELARQTAGATRNIKEKVEGIQNSTAGTVEEIGLISGVIEHVRDMVSSIASAVEEQSATTREIADNVVNSSGGIHEINVNISQTSEATGNISEDISGVSLFAGEIAENSAHVSTSADTLSHLATSLSSLIGEFKIPPQTDDI